MENRKRTSQTKEKQIEIRKRKFSKNIFLFFKKLFRLHFVFF